MSIEDKEKWEDKCHDQYKKLSTVIDPLFNDGYFQGINDYKEALKKEVYEEIKFLEGTDYKMYGFSGHTENKELKTWQKFLSLIDKVKP